MNWLRPLLMMFYAPTRGMAEARERAPLGPAFLLALLAQCGVLLYVLGPHLTLGEFARSGPRVAVAVLWSSTQSVLFVAIVFVPLLIFVANLFERRGSFGVVLQQEYAPAASAVFYARAAASLAALPLAVLARASGFEAEVYGQTARMLEELQRQSPEAQLVNPVQLAESFAFTLILPLFALWLVAAAREAFGFSWGRAVAAVLGAGALMVPASLVFGWLFAWVSASPFLLLMLFFLMRGYLGELMRGQRARASFRQNLEAATLNPADASAHYNLGLLHQQRKEFAEARTRFLRAVEIDPEETDAHYQLGRIARAEGRLADAIAHFGEAVSRDDAHAQHEIWREVGATYIAAGQFGDAQDALERFLARRPSDPEALYLMGRAAAGLGDRSGAREWMQRCVEAVRTAPAYKYRADKRWLNEAQQFLRTQS
ncbi:MAG TPA: tetratricopeptide repeat protein [Pyrinomonadaceae bacterium]|jgi:tetratricopeptide (TPR) repeat protein